MLTKVREHRAAAVAVAISALVLAGSLTAGATGASPVRIARKALRIARGANTKAKSAQATATSAKTLAQGANRTAGQALVAAHDAAGHAGPVFISDNSDLKGNLPAVPATGSVEDVAACPAPLVPTGGGVGVFDSSGAPVTDGIAVTSSAIVVDDRGELAWLGAVKNEGATGTGLVMQVTATCVVPANVTGKQKVRRVKLGPAR